MMKPIGIYSAVISFAFIFFTQSEANAQRHMRERGNPAQAEAVAPAEENYPQISGLVSVDQLDPELRCGIGRELSCDIAVAKQYGLIETGLIPQFPEGFECREIDEAYAISYTAKRDREQYHGGIDMPAPWGTPMIAAADGVVVANFEGKRSFRGREIILRHRPEDTGFPFYIYTQYAHFDAQPEFKVGDTIHMGQVLGPTGNSGIGRNGAQSQRRRPAIHFATWFSPVEQFAVTRGKVIPRQSLWMDPNALFLPKDHALESKTLQALPNDRKHVPVAIMLEDGTVVPKGSKVVWPYHCWKK